MKKIEAIEVLGLMAYAFVILIGYSMAAYLCWTVFVESLFGGIIVLGIILATIPTTANIVKDDLTES